MKKVTTATIAIAILILLTIIGIASSRDNNMSHGFSPAKIDSPDGVVKSFLEMMIPHHTEAVENSKLVMVDADISLPEVRLLAARIADTQEFEINQMEGWYEEWFGTPYLFDPSMYNPMMGDTGDLKGDARAKVYLQDMIKHHEHAVESSEAALERLNELQEKNSTNDGTLTITNSHQGIDATVSFAQKIQASQLQEIEEMKALLKKL